VDAELNLDIDAPDKAADVLKTAAIAYQASAVELAASWQDRKIPMIWAEIAGELDIGSRSSSSAIRLLPSQMRACSFPAPGSSRG